MTDDDDDDDDGDEQDEDEGGRRAALIKLDSYDSCAFVRPSIKNTQCTCTLLCSTHIIVYYVCVEASWARER